MHTILPMVYFENFVTISNIAKECIPIICTHEVY